MLSSIKKITIKHDRIVTNSLFSFLNSKQTSSLVSSYNGLKTNQLSAFDALNRTIQGLQQAEKSSNLVYNNAQEYNTIIGLITGQP